MVAVVDEKDQTRVCVIGYDYGGECLFVIGDLAGSDWPRNMARYHVAEGDARRAARAMSRAFRRLADMIEEELS